MRVLAAAMAMAMLAGCEAGGPVSTRHDGTYLARVAVEGGGRCGASGQNMMRVRRGMLRIETRSTVIRGRVEPDGRISGIGVESSLDLTGTGEGRIDGNRFRLTVDTTLQSGRGSALCRYRYEGALVDPKELERDKFAPTEEDAVPDRVTPAAPRTGLPEARR
jgi:hypothetical protein